MGEEDIANRLKNYIHKKVKLCPNVFLPNPKNLEKLYDMDCLVIVNTDSRLYTTTEYWFGKSDKHGNYVDLTRIKQMIYIFNYIISPAKSLSEIEMYCPNVKIITTNTKFFKEIAEKQEDIIHIPRIVLESPINKDTILQTKTKSNEIRIGMHSKPQEDKWNKDWPLLITTVNEKIGEEKIKWRFMGGNNEFKESIKKIKNTEFNKEFSLSIKDFLLNLDVFVFFTCYNREEPWSRVVAEAMMSGCPVIALKKGGNVDQIIHGNNGFLCENIEDVAMYTSVICENTCLLNQMKRNCIKRSEAFSSSQVIKKLLDFMEW
jgi:glycosyltransferase involved in cell wall biosynthesis